MVMAAAATTSTQPNSTLLVVKKKGVYTPVRAKIVVGRLESDNREATTMGQRLKAD